MKKPKLLPLGFNSTRTTIVGGTGHQAAHFATMADKIAAIRAKHGGPRTVQDPNRPHYL